MNCLVTMFATAGPACCLAAGSLVESLLLAALMVVITAGILWVVTLKRQVREQASLIQGRMEHAQALEQRYRDLVENAREIVYTLDLAGNCTSLNRAGEDILGYSRQEALRMNIRQIMGPKQWEFAQAMIQQKVAGESLNSYEIEVMTKAGRLIILEVSSRPIDHDGRPYGVQGIARDITERKRREDRSAAFSALAQRLSLATSVAEASRIVVDIADQLLGWDACYMHLLTPDSSSLIPILNCDIVNGQRISVPRVRGAASLAPMDKKVIEEGAQLVLREEPFERLPGLVTFGDTQRLSASLMFVPIRTASKVVGVLSIQSYTPKAYNREALDLLQSLADFCAGAMERIQAEGELRKSQELVAKAFRATPISIAISTLAEGRILDVNDGYLRLFGFTREEVIGRRGTEIGIWIRPEDRVELVRLLETQRFVRNKQYRFRTKTGEFREVLVSAEVIELDREPCGLFIACDLTERLQLENQLRHSQKMEAVGRLAAGIAHDFNNIMTIIQGHSSLAVTTPGRSAEMAESWQQVSEAAERAAHLTRQLLTFSRRQILQPRLLNLNGVLSQMATMLTRVLGEDITLEFRYAAELPMIRADSGMMDQLLMNLALNARDAMPEGGCLNISTAVEEIDATQAQSRAEAWSGFFVCLRVNDTGCGMDAETLSRIFEPFFTTKDIGKGTGLGLATVYGIVQQHQGWIEVTSEVGHGTGFKVYLPAELNSLESPSRAGLETSEALDPKGRPQNVPLANDRISARSDGQPPPR